MYPPVLEAVKSLIKQRIPITSWLPKYTLPDGISDVVAGITVGLTLMPQAIAYAALAGVDPQVSCLTETELTSSCHYLYTEN